MAGKGQGNNILDFTTGTDREMVIMVVQRIDTEQEFKSKVRFCWHSLDGGHHGCDELEEEDEIAVHRYNKGGGESGWAGVIAL